MTDEEEFAARCNLGGSETVATGYCSTTAAEWDE